MDWLQIFGPAVYQILGLVVFPALLVLLFPKTWAWPKQVCECNNRALRLRIVGSFDVMLMGILIVVALMYFVNEASIVMVPFLLFFKWLIWLIERQKYEFSSAEFAIKRHFPVVFMAWDDIVEINTVSPLQR